MAGVSYAPQSSAALDTLTPLGTVVYSLDERSDRTLVCHDDSTVNVADPQT